MYPDERVVRMVTENFLPVRVHVREQADDYERLSRQFGAEWTPTILLLDGTGEERHRIEGFLPVDDFLAQLRLGLGRMQFSAGNFAEAEKRFRAIVDEAPGNDVAPEALYWAGVAKYKRTGEAAALAATADAFGKRYPGTAWAKKASVWAK